MTETTKQKVVENNIEEVKAYTLRPLQASDIFVVTQIITKIGFKEFKKAFGSAEIATMIRTSEDNEALVEQVGFTAMIDIAGIVLSNLQYAEKDIYTFLTSLSSISEKDLKALSPATFAEMVIDVVQKEELKDFIGVVLKSFK